MLEVIAIITILLFLTTCFTLFINHRLDKKTEMLIRSMREQIEKAEKEHE